MSALHWVQTIVEILILVAVVLGFFYEPALARWETKQKEKVLKAYKERKVFRK